MENLEILLKQKQDTFYKVKGGAVSFEVKDVDMTKRTVDVVMNTLNYLDSDMDMLLPDCAKRSLKERGPDSSATAKIKYCKDHNLNQSIGKWTELSQKEIIYKGQSLSVLSGSVYLPTTTAGNDQLINYQEKIIDNHSIGFQYENIFAVEKDAHGNSTQWDKYYGQLLNPEALDGKDYFFAVKEINWFEGSSVAFGANSLTPYLGVKSASDKVGMKTRLFDRLELLGKMLSSGSQSDDCMKDFQLQMLQLKQLIDELSDGFEMTEKQKALERSKTTEPLNLVDVSTKFELRL